MRTKTVVHIAALVALVICQGCTSTIVRETSEELAGQVATLNNNLSAYENQIDRDASERIHRIALKDTRNAELQAELDEILAVLDLADSDETMRIYEGVVDLIDKRVASELALKTKLSDEKARLKAGQTKFISQQKALAALAKSLRELGKPMDRQEELKFLVEFANEAKKTLDKLNEQAEDEDS